MMVLATVPNALIWRKPRFPSFLEALARPFLEIGLTDAAGFKQDKPVPRGELNPRTPEDMRGLMKDLYDTS